MVNMRSREELIAVELEIVQLMKWLISVTASTYTEP